MNYKIDYINEIKLKVVKKQQERFLEDQFILPKIQMNKKVH